MLENFNIKKTLSYQCIFTWVQNTSAEARGWSLVNQRNLCRHHTILKGDCTHKPRTLNRFCIQLQQCPGRRALSLLQATGIIPLATVRVGSKGIYKQTYRKHYLQSQTSSQPY